jgi:hypothetical protein
MREMGHSLLAAGLCEHHWCRPHSLGEDFGVNPAISKGLAYSERSRRIQARRSRRRSWDIKICGRMLGASWNVLDGSLGGRPRNTVYLPAGPLHSLGVDKSCGRFAVEPRNGMTSARAAAAARWDDPAERKKEAAEKGVKKEEREKT